MVYAFKPKGWKGNVLETLGNKGPDPLNPDPEVERLDRDLYLVAFTAAQRGRAPRVYEFEADIVGRTVLARSDAARKYAYLTAR